MAGSGWREWALPFAPFALWLAVIFVLSSGSGSAEETSRFITPILKYFFPQATSDDILAYHLLIRKCAHFTEYAVLAAFAYRAFLRLPADLARRYAPLLAVIAAAATASIDELHQVFEPSRTGSATDVLIDISGAVFASVVITIMRRCRRPAVPEGPSMSETD